MSVIAVIMALFSGTSQEPWLHESELQVVSAESEWMLVGPCAASSLSSLERVGLWRGSAGRADEGMPYEDALAKTSSLKERQVRDIEVDLERSGPGITYCGKVDMLERVLKAFAVRNPAVGYVQGLNMIAAQFLVLGLSEEEAFLGLAFLVEQVAHDYYIQGFPGFFADMELLDTLLKSHYPDIAGFLEAFDQPSLVMLNDQNGLTLFTVSLPPSALLRVWDRIMERGRKGLVAAQLAVIVSVLRDFREIPFSSDDFPSYAATFKKRVGSFARDKVDALIQEVDAILLFPEIKAIKSFNKEP